MDVCLKWFLFCCHLTNTTLFGASQHSPSFPPPRPMCPLPALYLPYCRPQVLRQPLMKNVIQKLHSRRIPSPVIPARFKPRLNILAQVGVLSLYLVRGCQGLFHVRAQASLPVLFQLFGNESFFQEVIENEVAGGGGDGKEDVQVHPWAVAVEHEPRVNVCVKGGLTQARCTSPSMIGADTRRKGRRRGKGG